MTTFMDPPEFIYRRLKKLTRFPHYFKDLERRDCNNYRKHRNGTPVIFREQHTIYIVADQENSWNVKFVIY